MKVQVFSLSCLYKRLYLSMIFAIFGLACSVTMAGTVYRPFTEAERINAQTLEKALVEVEKKIKNAGFQVVGVYSPYKGAKIIGITSGELKAITSKIKHGGFAAVLHVSLTQVDEGIEVSYTNPSYFGYAYQVGSLESVALRLEDTLGVRTSFGSRSGIFSSDLKKWHKMWGMPFFTDATLLKRFDSHQQAIAALKTALAHPDSDMRQVWSVKVSPNQTIFGVQLHKGYWRNNRVQKIMQKLDVTGLKRTASLPWEILVQDNRIVYLPGKYRIALVFPDVSLETFMRISQVPDEMDKSAQKLIALAK